MAGNLVSDVLPTLVYVAHVGNHDRVFTESLRGELLGHSLALFFHDVSAQPRELVQQKKHLDQAPVSKCPLLSKAACCAL